MELMLIGPALLVFAYGIYWVSDKLMGTPGESTRGYDDAGVDYYWRTADGVVYEPPAHIAHRVMRPTRPSWSGMWYSHALRLRYRIMGMVAAAAVALGTYGLLLGMHKLLPSIANLLGAAGWVVAAVVGLLLLATEGD